ncbi:MAG: type II toxin-antitoxin system HicA family toxin [Candidatus Woesearchaeota archaeon]
MLPTISGLDTIKRLKKAGFVVVRQRGDHVRIEKNLKDKTIKLTVPLHDPLKKGTLRRIIKDAELSIRAFNDLD